MSGLKRLIGAVLVAIVGRGDSAARRDAHQARHPGSHGHHLGEGTRQPRQHVEHRHGQARDAEGVPRRQRRQRVGHGDQDAHRHAAGGAPHRRRPVEHRQGLQRLHDSVLLRERRGRTGRAEGTRAATRGHAAEERLPLRGLGHGRLGPDLLEEAAEDARGCEGLQHLREQRRCRNAAVVHEQRLPPEAADARGHRDAAEAAERHD